MPPDHPASDGSQQPGAQPDWRQGFRVGDWDVHPLQGVMAQGNHRVHVEPKVMDVLLCLANHAGRVVTRDVLLAEVWKGVVVTDDVVTRCISELRTVLRDTGRDRHFIRTIPKRGYSLLVPVEPLGGTAPGVGPDQRPEGRPEERPEASPVTPPVPASTYSAQWAMDGALQAVRKTVTTTRSLVRSALLGIGLIIVTVIVLAVLFSDDDDGPMVEISVGEDPAAELQQPETAKATARTPAPPARYRSLAVLPLVNLSGKPEHEYFSDGLAEDIRNALISATDLRVAARTSSMAFHNKPMDVREIARQLNVEALLEGTVRIDDSRLRVTAQVTDGRTGYPIWASSFERPVTDKLALQAEVAEAIIHQLAPSIATGNPMLGGATGNERAHDAYLLGRYYWNQRTRESIERSIGYFEQALARDPDYALAYSGLADAWSLLVDYGDRTVAEVGPRASQYARKALALNPDLAEAHASLGTVLKMGGDLPGALVAYQKAVELQPGYATGQMWLGTLLLGMGDATRASKGLEAALALDPLHPSVQVNYVSSLIARGELDRARTEARRLLALTPNSHLQKMLWHVSLEKGDFVDVLTLAVGQTSGPDTRGVFSDAVIEALIYLQRFDEAARMIAENRAALDLPRRLALEASLAVARRDAPTLRRVAVDLSAPVTKTEIPVPNQPCSRLWAALWLGVADLLEDRTATARKAFQSVAKQLEPLNCSDDSPALRLIALTYALESEARMNAGAIPVAAADASKEIEKLRLLGWKDASFCTAEIAVAIISGDEQEAESLLRNNQNRGVQPYGRMRASPLFDRLWNLPPLKQAEPVMAAEFQAAQKRAAGLKLAKLGL